MPERRMVRKDIWDDQAFASLTIPARLLYIALITHADDEGCFRANPDHWSRHIFYGKRQGPIRVERMLDEMREAKLIITGETKKGLAGVILQWFNMQTLAKDKSKPSEYSDLLVANNITPRWGSASKDNERERIKINESQSNASDVFRGREKMLEAMGDRAKIFEQ